MPRSELERLIGAVLIPEVRVPGTPVEPPGGVHQGPHPGCSPGDDYLHRFPPAAVIVYGRTPLGPVSPRALLEDLAARCTALGFEPPLVACDLEQGAGQHFPEGTLMPPALALAAAAKGHGDTGHGLNWVRSAAYVTALEARALGVDLVLAPVADVNTRRDNPIIATRSFGDVPAEVGLRASAFCEGLLAGGAGACAKHFPGHGDTSLDSHLVLPRIEASTAELRERELVPFRALVEAGVDVVMVGHLDVPSVTGRAGHPTCMSRPTVTGLLRGELGFGGPVLTDAMNMGALDTVGGARYALALRAGCDGLLSPHDPAQAAAEIQRAIQLGDLGIERLQEAAGRMRALRRRLRERRGSPRGTRLHPGLRAHGAEGEAAAARASEWQLPFDPEAHRAFAATVAERSLCATGSAGDWAGVERFAVRPAFPDAPLPPVLDGLWREPEGDSDGLVLAMTSEVRAGAGRYGLSPEHRRQLEERVRGLTAEGVRVALVWFASPQTLPLEWWEHARLPTLVAFAPTEPMVRAVQRFLAGVGTATGSLPAQPG